MVQRKYEYPLSDLLDRLSIVQLKAIRIPEHKKQYQKEIDDILHDIDLILSDKSICFNAESLHAIMIIMLTNNTIWENESKARKGGAGHDNLLKFTHSINGMRNTAKNIVSQYVGDREDLKIDCLAAEFQTNKFIKKWGDWQIWQEKSRTIVD